MFYVTIIIFTVSYFNIATCLFPKSHGIQTTPISREEINAIHTPVIEAKWIEQPLDHFDDSENHTFKMRYFERLDTWESEGPVYLFINEENRAHITFLKTGIMSELALETKGAMFLSEHRYYGDSKPFVNITTENLRFLSSRQALADVAGLLKQIKSSPQFNSSKVVVVGGSYGGNLAAWMKQLYPDLVDAAIASSAPVLAKADFHEDLETVSDDFKKYGTPGCFDKIVEIFQQYKERFNSENDTKLLKIEEEICDDTNMEKIENQQVFVLLKALTLQYHAVQYGNIFSIKYACEQIIRSSRVFTDKYGFVSTWDHKMQCFDYEFKTLIEHIQRTDWWWLFSYQQCTEFGFFQTLGRSNQLFTGYVPLEFFYNACKALFGEEFDETRIHQGIIRTNEMYGGLHPNVTKVVFVNGDLDPWRRLSILEDLSPDAPAKVIPFASHCQDLSSDSPTDSEELKDARKYIKDLVKKWIRHD